MQQPAGGVSMIGDNGFSRWLVAGLPSAAVLGVLSVLVLHVGAKIRWKVAIPPVIVLVSSFAALYIVMYWVRRQFRQSHDLRPAVLAFGIFSLVTGLIGMKYAEQLGIVSSTSISANYVPFSIYVGVVTVLTVILFTFWKFE